MFLGCSTALWALFFFAIFTQVHMQISFSLNCILVRMLHTYPYQHLFPRAPLRCLSAIVSHAFSYCNYCTSIICIVHDSNTISSKNLHRIFDSDGTLFTIVQSLVARLVLTNHPQKLPLSS